MTAAAGESFRVNAAGGFGTKEIRKIFREEEGGSRRRRKLFAFWALLQSVAFDGAFRLQLFP